MKSIGHQTLKLPAHAPVMVLPEAQLFPGAFLPLYIFEPRYRAMLTWSLEHDRMFCIAAMKPGITEAQTTGDFHHTVGLGLIRASVQREDGTSELVLLGLARMRIAGILQDTPFRLAELRELTATPISPEDNKLWAARLLETFDALFADAHLPLSSLRKELQQVDQAAVLADIIAHACLRSPAGRQAVFEEMDVARRAMTVIRHLRVEALRPEGQD